MFEEYRIFTDELKVLLKAKGMTYRDLGREMGLSEAGIKRIFGAQDGKLSTLVKVCEAMGLSFGDLIQSSQLTQRKPTFFSQEQDEVLAREFYLYVFFNELVIRRKTPEHIAQEHNLSSVFVERCLRRLEKLEIIRRTKGGKIRCLLPPPIGIRSGSPLRKKLYGAFIPSLAQAIMDPKISDDKKLLHSREWSIGVETLNRFKSELEDIIKKYDAHAARDEKLLSPEIVTFSISVNGILEISPYKKILENA